MSTYRRNKNNLPVGLKTCPKCNGTGNVPCTGREYHQEQHRLWAESLHGKFVTVPFLADGCAGESKWTRVPGLAIKHLFPGGWWGLKVYVSANKAPNWGKFDIQRYGYDEDYDLIDGHRFYWLRGKQGERQEVIPIKFSLVTEELEGLKEALKLTGGNHEEPK